MPPGHRKHQQKHQSLPAKGNLGLGFLFFKADGSQVTIQHCSSHGDGISPRPATVPSLRLDLRAGKVWVGPVAPLPIDSPKTLGIVGLLKLEHGAILVLVSKAKRVCSLLDGPVYKVEDTTLVANEAINACTNDLRYAALLQEAFTPKCFGEHLYFSHSANITSSRQRQATASSAASSPAAAEAAPAIGPRRPPPPPPSGADGGGGLPSLGAWWVAGGGGADSGAVGGGGGFGGAELCSGITSKVRSNSNCINHSAAAAPDSYRAAGGGGGGSGGGSDGDGKSARGGGGGCGTGSLWSRADPRFLWNRELMRPLIDAGAESFALPIMAGFVGQATGATLVLKSSNRSSCNPCSSSCSPRDHGNGSGAGVRAPGDLTLITRLGVGRPVAGSWRRGADTQGHTAGFAETEVVLTVWQPEEDGNPAATSTLPVNPGCNQLQQDQQYQPQQPPEAEVSRGQAAQDPGAAAAVAATAEVAASGNDREGDGGWLQRRTRVAVASYVMVRGSVPLFSAAPPDMRPCPRPRGPEDARLHIGPFRNHVTQLHASYGRSLLLLNLIFGANRRGQLRIQDTLKQLVEAHSARTREEQQQHQRQETPRGNDDLAPVQEDSSRGADGAASGADPAVGSTTSSTPPYNAGTAAAAPPPPPPPPEKSGGRAAGEHVSAGPGSDGGGSAAAVGAAAEKRHAGGGQFSVSLVGLLLRRGELSELAACGDTAARLERLVAEEGRRIRAFVSLDDFEMAVPPPPPPPRGYAAAAAVPPGTAGQPAQPHSLGARFESRCVGRRVHCLQGGVVRVSSGSTGSASGCCEEVDLAQYALALPVLADALVAVGAMDDPADLGAVHASVIHALAHLWSHMADVLSDQVLGTASRAGKSLRAAAAALERGSPLLGLPRGLLQRAWDEVLTAGESVSRYYYSNFTDARRQDALDLATGVCKMTSPPAELPRRKPPSTTTLQLGVLLLLAASIQAVLLLSVQRPFAGLSELGMRVLGPAALGLLLLLEVLRQGTNYVEHPLLQLPEGTGTYPWTASR